MNSNSKSYAKSKMSWRVKNTSTQINFKNNTIKPKYNNRSKEFRLQKIRIQAQQVEIQQVEPELQLEIATQVGDQNENYNKYLEIAIDWNNNKSEFIMNATYPYIKILTQNEKNKLLTNVGYNPIINNKNLADVSINKKIFERQNKDWISIYKNCETN